MLFFCLFQCFEETEYQTESKRNETFGNVIFSPNMIRRLGPHVKKQRSRPRGRGVRLPPPSQARPTLVGPCCSTDVLLPPIYTYVSPTDRGQSQKPNSTSATFCIREIPSWGLFRSSAGRGPSSRRASTSS